MGEILIQHFDEENYATIEAHGDQALAVLQEMGVESPGYGRYRVPIDRLGEFCDRRFGVERINYRRPQITETQKEARRESLARVRERRWRQA